MSKQIQLKKKERGITLIALVITIIVLLILATISIATLTGENGILNKASNAKETQKLAEMKELLELAIQNLQVEKQRKMTVNDITSEYLNSEIKDYECTVKEKSENNKIIRMEKDNIQ